jgi:hypothetical protein
LEWSCIKTDYCSRRCAFQESEPLFPNASIAAIPVETTSRTSSPQINHWGEISHYGAASLKNAQKVEKGQLAVVQKVALKMVMGWEG